MVLAKVLCHPGHAGQTNAMRLKLVLPVLGDNASLDAPQCVDELAKILASALASHSAKKQCQPKHHEGICLLKVRVA